MDSAADQKSRLDAKFRSMAESFQYVQATVQGIEPAQATMNTAHGAAEILRLPINRVNFVHKANENQTVTLVRPGA